MIKIKIQLLLLITGILLFSCSKKKKQERQNTFAPIVVEALGYVLPQDSMGIPPVILVNESTQKKIPTGKPTVVLTNTNIHIAIATNIHLAGTPRLSSLGSDTFLLPKKVPARDSAFVAGIPEITLAKDPHIKDNNPQSFSSFGKLQGLKHSTITCMIQDKSGNIWFGTNGGGVSKYDGKSFTHFTEKEGLSNNFVRSMLEDKSGNIWFGSEGAGVCKYDGLSFTHFTEKEGLSNNTVRSILEDKSGNIWFGTEGGGVNKYDGSSFTHFTEKEGLSNNIVVSMLEDKSGNIWFGTIGSGVCKYDGCRVEAIEVSLHRGETIPHGTQQDLKRENGKLVKSFTHFTKNEGLSNNTILSMLEDKSGNIWFGTEGGGVNKYDGSSFTHFTEKEGLSNNIVLSMLEDISGNVWFGTIGGGVSKYDGNRVEAIEAALQRGETIPERIQQDLIIENGKLVKSFTHFTEKEGLSNNIVSSVLEDKSGNIWFGTSDGGVSKYDGKTFTHFTEKEGLSNNIVLSILEDKSGNLWFGTLGGVDKYDGKSFTHFTEKEGLSNNSVLSILEDKSGNLWVGTIDGGVNKYDGSSFTHFTEKEGLSNNFVKSMLEDKSGNIWFGTNGDGVSKYDGLSFTHFTEKEGLSNNFVKSMLEDKSGNIWFGTNGGGVCKYDGNRVEAIEAALQRGETIPEGTLHDLKRENGKLIKSFTHFTEKEGLSNNIVLSMLEDKSGNLWFGTNGGGVCKYDGNRVEAIEAAEKSGAIIPQRLQYDLKNKNGKRIKSFTHFTEKEGLISNAVLSMLEDKSGNLWFGTRFGLSKLSPEKKEALFFFSKNGNASKGAEEKNFFKNYTYEDGFYGIGVIGGKTIFEDKKGTIWIAANDRLTAFHPEGERPDTVAPNIQLTGIELFNENIPWVNLEKKKDSPLTLGNGARVCDFKFDGLTKWYSLPKHLSLVYNNNYLTFNFIGITQKQNTKVKYKYKLAGLDQNWSAITSRTQATYGNLPPGTYTFQVKAMNSEGYWSNELNYTFTIRSPWWKTWWAYSIYGLLITTSFLLIVWWNGRQLRTRAIKLTEEVRMATVIIRKEKEKIELANEETEKQKEIVEEKSEKLAEALKNITDSINYALRIQQAILPDTKEIYASLPHSFILFKPKDIVSGDFYFFHKNNESNIIIAAADCTGHGVPGAFMSMVGSERIKDAVQQSNNTSELLSLLNKGVKNTLKQSNKNESTRDGMDIVICKLNTKNRVVNYAGANRPLWIIRKGQSEVEVIKATKVAIGGLTNEAHYFETHEIELQQDDTFYIFTDGYADQFGGHDSKKLMTKKLKNILLSIQSMTMEEQKQYLENFLENWRSGTEQVDDILVIGIRL